jgi:hypothetical protein
MPMDRARVIHIPGVIDTTKNVGTKAESSDQLRINTV